MEDQPSSDSFAQRRAASETNIDLWTDGRIYPLDPATATPFFADSSGYIHHEGLYIGDNKMVHSPKTGDVVKISDITSAYYTSQYAGARRYSPSTG